MFNDFTEKLTDLLSKKGFHAMVFAEGFFSMYRTDGNVLYYTACYDTDSAEADGLYQSRRFFDSAVEFGEQFNIRNIIIFNVYATSSSKKELNALIPNAPEAYAAQSVFEINYAVSLLDEKICYSKKQPYDLMSFDKMLKDCLSNENTLLHAVGDDGEPNIYDDDAAKVSGIRGGVLSYILILINAALLYFLIRGGGFDVPNLIRSGALLPFRYINGEYYRLFTSMFLHSGLLHFASNALWLYIIGTRTEQAFGKLWFVVIYLFSGLAGNVLSMFTVNAVSIGASGAVFGLVGAALAYTRVTKKHIGGLPFQTLLIIIIFNIGFGFMNEVINNAAHIGGLLAGFCAGYLIVKLKAIKIN